MGAEAIRTSQNTIWVHHAEGGVNELCIPAVYLRGLETLNKQDTELQSLVVSDIIRSKMPYCQIAQLASNIMCPIGQEILNEQYLTNDKVTTACSAVGIIKALLISNSNNLFKGLGNLE